MTNEEAELLKSLRGPNATLKADSKKYMTDFAFRSSVDAADKEKGTHVGRALKSIFYGKPEQLPAPPQPQAQQPSAIELANAVKQFPKARCIELFKRSANTPGEIASTLSKSDYATAKLAAKFHGVLDPNDVSFARFNYETSGQRRAKREAQDAAAKSQAEQLPPGISKDEKGNLILSDAQAFQSWKDGKNEHKEALQFLESQAS